MQRNLSVEQNQIINDMFLLSGTKDPKAPAVFRAYADEIERLGDGQAAAGIRDLAKLYERHS